MSVLPTTSYDFAHVLQLIAESNKVDIIEYIARYFYRTDLKHYYYKPTEGFTIITLKEIREQFFTAGHKITTFNPISHKPEHWKLIDYYTVQMTKRYSVVDDPFLPILTNSTINIGNRYSVQTVDL